MSSEKRVWIASILSAITLMAYASTFGRPPAKAPQAAPQDAQLSQQQPSQSLQLLSVIEDEDVALLDSSVMQLELSVSSGAIRAVTLKRYTDDKNLPLRISLQYPIAAVEIGEREPVKKFQLTKSGPRMASWKSESASDRTELTVVLDEKLPVVTIAVNTDNLSQAPMEVPIRLVSSWTRADEVKGAYNRLEIVAATSPRPGAVKYLTYQEGTKQVKNVPRGTQMVTLTERFFCQSIRQDPATGLSQTDVLPAPQNLLAVSSKSILQVPPRSSASYAAKLYFGPRDFFKLRDAGFESAFPVGILAKIGLVLIVFLNGIVAVVRNYGVGIILLSFGISTLFAPFTLMSFRSMKRMQELQPKLDHLKKKYEKEPQKLNAEMMALFREHKVSPLGGCLPMVLQMPIFFALWSAISHVIEFRGAKFLWIRDLSLPDRLFSFSGGFSLNILPILMAAAMYAQTKISQKNVAKNPQTAILSGPIMPIIFGVMFYQVPASLVLYWLTNTLISILSLKLVKL